MGSHAHEHTGPREHRVGARRRGAYRAAVRDDQRPAGDDLARRTLHAAEPRLGAAARLDARGAARTADPRIRPPRGRRADARRDASSATARRPSSRTSPTATATATARGAGCCGARAATATRWYAAAQGRDRPHVARAPGAARPAHAAAQPAAADGPRPPGARAAAPQRRRRRDAVHRPRQVQGRQRQPRPRASATALLRLGLRAARRADARQRHGGAPRRRRVRDPRRGQSRATARRSPSPNACSTRSSSRSRWARRKSSMLASVGISVSRDPDADPETMLREADVAMYRAKGAGGRRLELFDEALRRELDAHLELEDRLRHALPQHELLLAYQPILRARRRPGARRRGARALAPDRRRSRGERRPCCPRRSCRRRRTAS